MEKANLRYCSACRNRSFDARFGLICSLSEEKPDFIGECPDFKRDLSVTLEPQVDFKQIAINFNFVFALVLVFGGIFWSWHTGKIMIGTISSGVIDLVANSYIYFKRSRSRNH